MVCIYIKNLISERGTLILYKDWVLHQNFIEYNHESSRFKNDYEQNELR